LREERLLSHDTRMRKFMLTASLVFGLVACGKSAGDEALNKMEGFKNDMCACKDKACAEKVTKDMMDWMEKFAKDNKDLDKKGSKEQEEKAEKISKEMQDCMEKLMKG
jgi:succinate dehydrogenase/fumarate reductase flavoprotein subunit